YRDIGVLDGTLRRDRERCWQLKDEVRSDVPAVREGDRWGRVARITLGRAGVHPRCEGRDLRLGQPLVVGELPVARVGKPWRHHLARNGGPDGACPWPRA